jgi:hypothetical protein
LIFGLRGIALASPPFLLPLEAARARPPAAPAIAAPPATSGTFALVAALPTDLPALLALPPTALRTASTFEPLLDEPLLEGDFRGLLLLLAFEALAPLLELRLLLPVDLAFVAFAFDDFVFDLDDGFAPFDADCFFGLAFV